MTDSQTTKEPADGAAVGGRVQALVMPRVGDKVEVTIRRATYALRLTTEAQIRMLMDDGTLEQPGWRLVSAA